uniref:Uncharacterized protein n=1 Tax=Anguilla anguilla TaxID=7936 RepID=A0A0E9UH96_ANGAN
MFRFYRIKDAVHMTFCFLTFWHLCLGALSRSFCSFSFWFSLTLK